ncbi:MAG: helix-turn-helix transcriptional regulator [Bryobacteraceae bacterium]
MLPGFSAHRPHQADATLNGVRDSRLILDHESFVRLCRSRDFLAASLEQKPKLEDAARVAYLSPFHFHRQFARAFGETPHSFLRRMRIDRARKLLAADHLPVTEVCLAVGYESLGSFSTLFRSQTGMTPLEFRRAVRRVFPSARIPPAGFMPTCLLLRFGYRIH